MAIDILDKLAQLAAPGVMGFGVERRLGARAIEVERLQGFGHGRGSGLVRGQALDCHGARRRTICDLPRFRKESRGWSAYADHDTYGDDFSVTNA